MASSSHAWGNCRGPSRERGACSQTYNQSGGQRQCVPTFYRLLIPVRGRCSNCQSASVWDVGGMCLTYGVVDGSGGERVASPATAASPRVDGKNLQTAPHRTGREHIGRRATADTIHHSTHCNGQSLEERCEGWVLEVHDEDAFGRHGVDQRRQQACAPPSGSHETSNERATLFEQYNAHPPKGC